MSNSGCMSYPPHSKVVDFGTNFDSRDRCTSSQPSLSAKRPLPPQRKQDKHRMSSTASVYLTQRACAWFLDLDSGRKRGRSISGRRSWLLVRSGLVGFVSSTVNSWSSIDRRLIWSGLDRRFRPGRDRTEEEQG